MMELRGGDDKGRTRMEAQKMWNAVISTGDDANAGMQEPESRAEPE